MKENLDILSLCSSTRKPLKQVSIYSNPNLTAVTNMTTNFINWPFVIQMNFM